MTAWTVIADNRQSDGSAQLIRMFSWSRTCLAIVATVAPCDG